MDTGYESTEYCPRPYMPDPGLTVVKKVPVGRVDRIINLSLNESSLGASPGAVAACQARAETLMRYPDPSSTKLRAAIGKVHGLDPDRIVCGNGSEELIDVIARVYARPGDEILFSVHSFLQFPIVATRVGATQVKAPERDLFVDVDALLERVTPRTKILFLANPNNPTGTFIPADEVRRLRDGLPPSVVFVIDSAYAEYVGSNEYSSGAELVEGTENTIMTRTFSKAYGLAAVRVGWAYGPKSMITVLNRMRGIGNVNALAQATAAAALADVGFVDMVRRHTDEQRARMTPEIEALGLKVVPGAANFLLVEFPRDPARGADAAILYLAQRGIITRDAHDYDLDDHVRMTIGLEDENRAVVESLRDFMAPGNVAAAP